MTRVNFLAECTANDREQLPSECSRLQLSRRAAPEQLERPLAEQTENNCRFDGGSSVVALGSYTTHGPRRWAGPGDRWSGWYQRIPFASAPHMQLIPRLSRGVRLSTTM